MNIPIIYATTEGHTRKVAEFAEAVLNDLGGGGPVLEASAAGAADLLDGRGIILAGSVHAGHYQRDLVRFIRRHSDTIANMPALFLSVSLSAAGHDPEGLEELPHVVERFGEETGWTPADVVHVAGALKFSEYDFFKAWIMRRIAADKGETLGRHEDREYTDWDALRAAISGWVTQLG